MKTLITIFLSLHFLTASVVYSSKPNHSYIHKIDSNEKNIFAVKVGSQWRGAKVEVVRESGEVILQERLNKKRMKIDFNKLKVGDYTIKISKNESQEQFKYERR